MPDPCNASHAHHGGVACELDADHACLHRHGSLTGRVVWWWGEDDLATRAELVAEFATLLAAGVALRKTERYSGEPFVHPERWRAFLDGRRNPDGTPHQMLRRAAAIIQTLYTPTDSVRRLVYVPDLNFNGVDLSMLLGATR